MKTSAGNEDAYQLFQGFGLVDQVIVFCYQIPKRKAGCFVFNSTQLRTQRPTGYICNLWLAKSWSLQWKCRKKITMIKLALRVRPPEIWQDAARRCDPRCTARPESWGKQPYPPGSRSGNTSRGTSLFSETRTKTIKLTATDLFVAIRSRVLQ